MPIRIRFSYSEIYKILLWHSNKYLINNYKCKDIEFRHYETEKRTIINDILMISDEETQQKLWGLRGKEKIRYSGKERKKEGVQISQRDLSLPHKNKWHQSSCQSADVTQTEPIRNQPSCFLTLCYKPKNVSLQSHGGLLKANVAHITF